MKALLLITGHYVLRRPSEDENYFSQFMNLTSVYKNKMNCLQLLTLKCGLNKDKIKLLIAHDLLTDFPKHKVYKLFFHEWGEFY